MRDPLLSVTITNYNYAHLLPRALDSILAQSFTDFEIIIVDNASTDYSLDVLQRYCEREPRIRLITHAKNQGLAWSLAEAAAAVRGRYHVHIDADDWVIDSTAFERQIAVLERDPSISVVYSPIVMCDATGTIVIHNTFPADRVDSGERAVEQALMGKIINTGPMMRMSAFHSFGGYNMSFLYAIDVKLAIDLCGAGRVGYINRPLYAFYQHPNSLTHTSSVAAKQRELVRAVDSAFVGPLCGKVADAGQLRRRARHHMLTLHATQYIFASNYRGGWSALAHGFTLDPITMLSQRRVWSLGARTLLGDQRYQLLRTVLRRKHKQKSMHITDKPDTGYAIASMK